MFSLLIDVILLENSFEQMSQRERTLSNIKDDQRIKIVEDDRQALIFNNLAKCIGVQVEKPLATGKSGQVGEIFFYLIRLLLHKIILAIERV